MKQMASAVITKEYTQAYRDIQSLAKQNLNEQRKASVPITGIANNFDPDQKGFLTPALKGFAMHQVGTGTATYGKLVAHADYGSERLRNNPTVYDVPFRGSYQIKPQPGQVNLIYPAAANSPAFNTSFMRGGKALPYREYPRYELDGRSALIIRPGVDFLGPLGGSFVQNSPIPPGVRWWESDDDGVPVPPLALPHDMDGVVRRNIKPIPPGMTVADILHDDTYWTGTARDPLNWDDDFWYGYNNWVNKEGLAAYLAVHPGCILE